MLAPPHRSALCTAPASAALRAAAVDEVRASIIDHCDFETRRHLAQVSPGFRGALERPSRWAQHYSPAALDARNRVIHTGWRPTSRGSITDAYRLPAVAAPQALHGFENTTWTLRFDGLVDVPTDPALVALLDQVSEVTFQGLVEPHHAADDAHDLVVKNRPLAYAFLRDRAYRLNHGLPIPTYSHEARLWMASVALCMVGLGASVYCGYRAQARRANDPAGNTALNFWAAAALSYYAGVIAYLGAERAGLRGLKNIYHAPKHHQQLNTWCLTIFDAEVTPAALRAPTGSAL